MKLTMLSHGMRAGTNSGTKLTSGLSYHLHIACLIVLCAAAYSGTLDAPFMFDDFAYVETNPLIRDFGNYFDKEAALRTSAANPGLQEDVVNSFLVRPIAYMTFSLNYYFHGTTKAGYHLVNIAIHAINAVFVYLLVLMSIRHLQAEDTETAWTGMRNRKTAFLVAALFTVHPLMTNSVTYITQRMTSLVALFYLSSVLMYSIHLISVSRTAKMLTYCSSIISCIAAMLSKETAFTLPLMLVLYDALFSRSGLKQRMVRLVPFLLSMSVIPYNVIGLQNSGAFVSDSRITTAIHLVNFSKVSSGDYLLTQFRAVGFYLKQLLVPAGLSLEHDFRISHSLLEAGVLFSLLLHICLAGYAIHILLKKQAGERSLILNRLAGFGILWFYISLLVESSIIPMDQMAVEYRTYLPSCGIFLFLVCMVQRLKETLPPSRSMFREDYRVWAPVICILMVLTIARNETWKRPDEFWMQTISQYPKLARAYANLADHYIRQGELQKAVEVYRNSIREIPYEAVLYYELANVHMLSKDYEAAIIELYNALSLKPDMQKTYDLLTIAFISSGKYDQAKKTMDLARQMSQGLPAFPSQ